MGIFPQVVFLWLMTRGVSAVDTTKNIQVVLREKVCVMQELRNGLVGSFIRSSVNIILTPWNGSAWYGLKHYVFCCFVDTAVAFIVHTLAIMQSHYLHRVQK